jgi:GntR family transcriptional regulator / MocR family aminotransferase
VTGLSPARVPPATHARLELDLHLDVHLDPGETRPARALERALREAIVAGRVPGGHRLPPTRGLAADLGIARTTVSEVYAQLTAEGWLEARVGAGTWVTEAAQAPPPGTGRSEPPPRGSRRPAGRPGAVTDGVSRADPPGPAADPRLVNLYGGRADPSRFPRQEWLMATRRALESASVTELGDLDPGGALRLRQQLAVYLARTRGVAATVDRTLIGRGFGGLLALACQALVADGARRMAVEEFGHPEHRDIVTAAGLQIVPLPVDERGADVTGLRGDVDAVLLTAAHQFPVGVPLSPARRRAVTGWAQATGGLVIEDDYDGEFRYERRAVGSLQAMAPGHVLYIGTASKALAPAVGLAWAVSPQGFARRMLACRSELDRPRDALNQLVLAEFLAGHAYDRHVRRMRAEYRRRRDHLEQQLASRVPAARLMGVPAGLQAAVELPAGSDPDAVVAEGLRRGVAFRTLAEYAVRARPEHPPAIVVGFGTPPASKAGAGTTITVAAIEAATQGAIRARRPG